MNHNILYISTYHNTAESFIITRRSESLLLNKTGWTPTAAHTVPTWKQNQIIWKTADRRRPWGCVGKQPCRIFFYTYFDRLKTVITKNTQVSQSWILSTGGRWLIQLLYTHSSKACRDTQPWPLLWGTGKSPLPHRGEDCSQTRTKKSWTVQSQSL